MLSTLILNAVVFLGRSDGVFVCDIPRHELDEHVDQRLQARIHQLSQAVAGA